MLRRARSLGKTGLPVVGRVGVGAVQEQEQPDGAGRDVVAQPDEFTLDATVAQVGFAAAGRRTSSRTSRRVEGRPGRRRSVSICRCRLATWWRNVKILMSLSVPLICSSLITVNTLDTSR
jgi:hypothetical protein